MAPRRALALLAVLTCVVGLAACGSGSGGGSDGGGKSPVHLALISFNTPGSSLLPEFQVAADAATKVINNQGGFGGRKLVIDTCNSMLQPSAATVCAHKTLADHPVAMVGCELTWSASGLPIYAAAKVPSINCLNNKEDVTNKTSFGLTSSAVGENRGLMRWICTQPYKSVVALLPNLPQYPGQIFPESVANPLKACGKTANPVYYPLTGVDVAPYVAKALGFKPDFILYTGIGAQVDSFYKAFQQAGWPASKVASVDTDFIPSTTSGAAGKLLEGSIVAGQFTTENNTAKDPDLATFTKALNGNTKWTNDPNVAWAYADIMFVYKAAKKIGFDKFNSATLSHFLSTADGASIPLSHALVNPGPKDAPQIKQPYTRIERWEKGKFVPLAAGPNKDGWINGW